MMHTEAIEYQCKGVKLKGHLAWKNNSAIKRPAVIVAHAWKGQDDFARQKACALAELGYVGFAADLYGNGIEVKSNEEAQKLMLPLFLDRALLRERINAAVEAIKSNPLVEPSTIAAIGFCFGGLAVIELLRSGADVRGVVSFHGTLGNSLGEHKAKLAPLAKKINGALLMLHGHDDPLVSSTDVLSIQEEFTKANVDWQMHIYGQTMHAFTNPEAHDERSGLMFNVKANRRSWETMSNFLEEIFA